MEEKLIRTIVDASTGEIFEVEYTEEETAEFYRVQNEFLERERIKQEELEFKNALKISATEKLKSLGLTDQEISAIIN
jgi:hypothetical protein